MTRPSKTRADFLSTAGQPRRAAVFPRDLDGPSWAFAQAAVDHVVIRRKSSAPAPRSSALVARASVS